MKLEKYRHIMILRTLISDPEPVTAASLAKLTKSSLRTIKNDITQLNKLCLAEGSARIKSYKAKGYKIVAEDEKKYKELCSSIEVSYSLFYGRSVESINRRMYILQRFLVDESVKIEELCEKLYLSRSSIRKDIIWAKRFLSSYHIDLDVVSGKGYQATGKEQDLRSALVELRCSQYHEFQPLYPYEPFDELFRVDGVNYYTRLRQAFLKILRESRITISDIETKKITSHICLMRKRMAEERSPELSEDIIKELKDTYDYEVAKQIFADETIRNYVKADEIEVLNFARLLLTNRDLNLRLGGIDDLPDGLVLENLKLFNEIIDDMKDSLGGSIHRLDLFRIYSRDLESLQMQLYLKHHFDHTGKMRFITYLEGSDDMYSPIPLEMTRAMIARLQIRFGEPISDALVMSYAAVYERLFKKIFYPYNKLSLAITTTEGLVYSQHIRETLAEQYSQYIRKIDIFNLYEMRRVNFDDYDAIVHSGFILYYNYPLPIVGYRELDYNRPSDSLFDKLFKNGFDRRELNRVKELLKVYPEQRINDIDGFVEALSYRYAFEPAYQEALYGQYVENEQIIDHYYHRNGIVLVFMPYAFTHKEVLDIYLPKQSLYREEILEVNALIAVSVDPKMDLADMKVLDHILRYLVQTEGALDRLINDKDGTLDYIFEAIIRRKFLNL
ncbi:MAG: HTH domain-containing protein [Erysipelotrichaceae bacterium]|nr:HTH domain-containing protein [Erysipelotrichaceae bacterium]